MNNLIDNILENISICNTIEAKKLNTKVIVRMVISRNRLLPTSQSISSIYHRMGIISGHSMLSLVITRSIMAQQNLCR